MSFDQCAQAYITAHRDRWRNTKHAERWGNNLRLHASPVIGKLPVDEVELRHVMLILVVGRHGSMVLNLGHFQRLGQGCVQVAAPMGGVEPFTQHARGSEVEYQFNLTAHAGGGFSLAGPEGFQIRGSRGLR